ncbi:MAG: hypothetical protein RMK01_09130 [Thermomicrobium sp.]|nr:hypothetical protein [Thermomicrobium sp.]MDW8060223.1 hypothetical protein [Thermomicrobium sp.]
MSPEAGRAALASALFVTLLAAGLLLLLPRDSPEFVVALLSLVVGLAFLVVVIVVIHRFTR